VKDEGNAPAVRSGVEFELVENAGPSWLRHFDTLLKGDLTPPFDNSRGARAVNEIAASFFNDF
jgi:hypothetical protein